MKLSGKSVDAFLRKPDGAVVAALFHGSDEGLIRERAQALAKTVVDDLSDAFRVAELTGAEIKDQPARLVDEAAQLALTGGRRVVLVRNAVDGAADAFKTLLETASPEGALVVAEAGSLGPRSALRKLFEGAKNARSIGCYPDGARDLHAVIDETLAASGLRATADARAFLVSHLGGDRLVSRGELEKLALYMGPGEAGAGGRPRAIELEDAMACVGDTGAMTTDALVFHACSGDLEGLDRVFERAMDESVHPVPILRALQRHLQRLHQAAARVAAGDSPRQATMAVKPPVIFIFQDQFQAQLRLWRLDTLAAALALATEAELECKTTDFPGRAGCHRALMRVAQAARGSRRAA